MNSIARTLRKRKVQPRMILYGHTGAAFSTRGDHGIFDRFKFHRHGKPEPSIGYDRAQPDEAGRLGAIMACPQEFKGGTP